MYDRGRPNWYFTDSQACFVGHELRLQKCVYPISSCVATPSGYECQLTTGFLLIAGALELIWLAAVVVYLHLTKIIGEFNLTLQHAESGGLAHGFRDILFPAEAAAEAAVTVPVDGAALGSSAPAETQGEQQPLLSNKSGLGAGKSGGTF